MNPRRRCFAYWRVEFYETTWRFNLQMSWLRICWVISFLPFKFKWICWRSFFYLLRCIEATSISEMTCYKPILRYHMIEKHFHLDSFQCGLVWNDFSSIWRFQQKKQARIQLQFWWFQLESCQCSSKFYEVFVVVVIIIIIKKKKNFFCWTGEVIETWSENRDCRDGTPSFVFDLFQDFGTKI